MGCWFTTPEIPAQFEFQQLCMYAKQDLISVPALNTEKSFFYHDQKKALWKLSFHPTRKEAMYIFNNIKRICRLPSSEYILKPKKVHLINHRSVAAKMPRGGRDLYDIVCQDFHPDIVLQALRDISEAVYWLHTHKVAHRDIKPENIVLHESRFKLIDFEFSSPLEEFHHCGTECYTCPPHITKHWPGTKAESSQRADVYAFGKMILFLVYEAGRHGYCEPYKAIGHLFDQAYLFERVHIANKWQPWLDIAFECCGKVPPLSIPSLPTAMENTVGTVDGSTTVTSIQVVDADPVFA